MSNLSSTALDGSDDLPALTDQDVNILYAITLQASQSPSPPFRALFAAYDDVLAENGIAAEHDQVYFRYLLRLGEGCRRNSLLVRRLKRLLEKLDIQIVVTEDDDEIEGFEDDEEQDDDDGEEEEEDVEGRKAGDEVEGGNGQSKGLGGRWRNEQQKRENGRRRRSSFNDSRLEETWVSGGRLDSDDPPVGNSRLDANGSGNGNGRHNRAQRTTSGSTDASGRPLTTSLIAQRLARGRNDARRTTGSRARSLSAQSSVRAAAPVPRKRRGHARQHSTEHVSRNRHGDRVHDQPEHVSRNRYGHSVQELPDHVLRNRHEHLVHDPPGHPSSHPLIQPDYTQQSDVGYDSPSSLDPSDSVYISSSPPPMPSPRPEHLTHHDPPPPPPPAYVPEPLPIPVEQLLANAEGFANITALRTARQLLHQWHDQTIRSQQKHHDMSQLATVYDSQTLLNQAISTWRSALADKQQAAETDRFFDQFERRATRARDMFLLNKAFTHWAQSASDEVARTNVARRHILRTRYFNAWRDITAVNELKCRRLGLRKWFPLWRAKTARKAVEDERALAIHEEKLVERTYWKWFWTFCERRAPVWQDTRLKKSALIKVAVRAAQVRQTNNTALETRNYHLTRRALSALAAKGQSVTRMDEQAVQYRQTRLLSLSFNTLRKHSQLAPRWRQFEQASSSRLAVRTIYTWSLSTTLNRRADRVHQQRLLQNAVTEWNDKLRIKAIVNMMDERIKAETWYKWMLLERLSLFRRETGYRLLERTLQTLSVRLAEQQFRLGEAEAIFYPHQRRRLLASTMLKFNRRSRNEEHLERLALEFRNERVLRPILPRWRQKHEHLQQLDRWSNDARFYCLTHSAIGRWKEATTNAKRLKRREAYTTVRRRGKVSLVRNCFQHWHERSDAVTEMKAQAHDRYRVRLFAIGTAAFDQWRQMTTHVADLDTQSEQVYMRRLFDHSISQLTEKGHSILQNHEEAESYATQTVHLAIQSEMMRRLKWHLFCLKRNKENAVALKERNASQHRRNMLRYWAEQASQQRQVKVAAAAALDPESPSKPTPNLFSSLRLPSARKQPLRRPATTSQLSDNKEDTDVSEDEEMDFGASTTRKAEEWTQYDFLRDFNPNVMPNTNNLPTLNEESEPPSNKQSQPYQYPAFGTPLPGYLRTPSKRTARQRTRFKTLGLSAPRPASAFAPFAPSSKPDKYNNDEDDNEDQDEDEDVTKKAIIASTTPAPLRPGDDQGGLGDMSTLTPQVTPFDRKMRAGGFGSTVRHAMSFTPATRPRVRPGMGAGVGPRAGVGTGAGYSTPGFGRSRFGRSILGGGGTGATGRSVRFFDGVASGGGSLNGDTPGGGVDLGAAVGVGGANDVVRPSQVHEKSS